MECPFSHGTSLRRVFFKVESSKSSCWACLILLLGLLHPLAGPPRLFAGPACPLTGPVLLGLPHPLAGPVMLGLPHPLAGPASSSCWACLAGPVSSSCWACLILLLGLSCPLAGPVLLGLPHPLAGPTLLRLFEDVPLVEFMYFVFTCMPGESCCR